MYRHFYNDEPGTTKPPYSIDLAASRIQSVAGKINTLVGEVKTNGKIITTKGDEVVTSLDVSFRQLSTDFDQLLGTASDKFAGFPLSILYTFLIVALVAIFLAMIFLIFYALHKFAAKKYESLDSPQPSEISAI
ncbi:unnamed protein product [Bursaphelenchus xylophilus]|uniref:(pine wood nematode) hypothetical protein n=1 Tax=Bursaphelenchus xylophilus TaxID=6326 RepID=A0A1I7S5K0_BURXY|nr:unnamed protein product [Bursaphelenchus xylophilus]CAG9124794.1 unnamed protein product [Bursaphelenchus xylophilus]